MQARMQARISHQQPPGGTNITDPHPALTLSLLKFSHWVSPTPSEITLRTLLKSKFVQVINKQIKDSEIQEFGSRGKPVEIWSSDLDLIVRVKNETESSGGSMTGSGQNSPRESNGNDSRTNSPKAFEAETFVGYDDSDSDGQDSDGLGFVGDESDEDGYEEDNFGDGGGGFVIDRNPSPFSVPHPSVPSPSSPSAPLDISLNLRSSPPFPPPPPPPPPSRSKTVKLLKRICKPLYSSPYVKKTIMLGKAKVPIINLITPWNVSVDIAIEGLGEDTSSYTSQFTSCPPYSPLVRLIKSLLKSYGYDRVYTGGLGSYRVYVMCGLVTDGGGSLGECFLKFLGWDWGRVREGFSYKGGEIDFKAVHKFDVILGFFSWVARAVLDGGVEAIFKEGKTGIVRARTESERRAKVGVNSNLLEVGEEVQGFGKGEGKTTFFTKSGIVHHTQSAPPQTDNKNNNKRNKSDRGRLKDGEGKGADDKRKKKRRRAVDYLSDSD
ncbi:hypothetical protein TrVE_jg5435 [Triparma verrucosa]|uniref:Polymerase nucleotidyl transferase domain-containing protein n=1 Tax=Triparma verrucosa TaxID=1606542 RepID=A0A9W7C6D1_9STRA|nr:hypothetical protein TrVE_jg5435 [Triparma verrucosa]